MLDFYKSQEFFDVDNMYKISIPRIISNILSDYDPSNFETQTLEHNEIIYKRDYFYPLSYDHQNNIFTDNTCMIHYYDASWTPKWEQRENKIFRIFGRKNGERLIKITKKGKSGCKRIIKFALYPLIKWKRKRALINEDYKKSIEETLEKITVKKEKYIVFHNPEWLGVTNATKELFENTVPCKELHRTKDINAILNKILECGYQKVIFSGFCIGWKELAIKLHSNNVVVQTYFHGSHSQVLEPYGWERNLEIFELAKAGIVKKMGTCKESLLKYYEHFGCKTYLLTNRVNIKKYKRTRKDNNFVVGVYASKTDNYRKNTFAELAAASLIKKDNVLIDMVPTNKTAIQFCKLVDTKIDGVSKPISREELLQRIANCDVVLYTTFSECAPMVPLESFAQDVICIVGDNCHYFKGEELEKYIVVSEENNPEEIAKKVEYAMENKDKILKLYKDWEKRNKERSDKLLKAYLEDGDINE